MNSPVIESDVVSPSYQVVVEVIMLITHTHTHTDQLLQTYHETTGDEWKVWAALTPCELKKDMLYGSLDVGKHVKHT